MPVMPAVPDELDLRVDDVFHRLVKPHLQPADDGKYVAIDLNTGDYEVDEKDHAAVMRLRARRPDGVLWLERAGQPTAYKMLGMR